MNRSFCWTACLISGWVLAAGLSTGCSKQSSPSPDATNATPAAAPAPAPAPPSDADLTRQVQAQLQADSALSGNTITATAVNGMVTLSGAVPDAAARELAGNDAGQVNGVRTVVNNLTVAAPAPATPSAEVRAADRARQQREQARLKQQQREKARREQEQAAQAAAQQQAAQAAAQQQAAQAAAAQQAQQQAMKTPPPPPPPPKPIKRTLTIPAGSDIAIRTTEPLETGKVQSQDTFHGVLADSLVVNGVTAIHRGADVTGVVLDAKDAAHFKGRAQLSLGLQQIKTGGRMLNVSTEPLLQEGKARGKNTAEKAGGGALLGTLIGALAGGGRGALIGAAAGAGTGAGVNAVTRGDQVKIPSESVLHFVLSQPLNVTVTVMPGSSNGNPGSGRWGAQGSGQPQLQQPGGSQPQQDQGPPQ